MAQFRQAIVEVLIDHADVRRGASSQETAAYRKAVVQSYLGKGKGARARWATLECTLRGDWQNHNHIEIYVGWDETNSVQHVIEKLSWDILFAIAPRALRVFNRKSWTGLSEALADICFLDAVHGI
eukprot:9497884-Pyramimonas_sp.AAC.1